MQRPKLSVTAGYCTHREATRRVNFSPSSLSARRCAGRVQAMRLTTATKRHASVGRSCAATKRRSCRDRQAILQLSRRTASLTRVPPSRKCLSKASWLPACCQKMLQCAGAPSAIPKTFTELLSVLALGVDRPGEYAQSSSSSESSDAECCRFNSASAKRLVSRLLACRVQLERKQSTRSSTS